MRQLYRGPKSGTSHAGFIVWLDILSQGFTLVVQLAKWKANIGESARKAQNGVYRSNPGMNAGVLATECILDSVQHSPRFVPALHSRGAWSNCRSSMSKDSIDYVFSTLLFTSICISANALSWQILLLWIQHFDILTLLLREHPWVKFNNASYKSQTNQAAQCVEAQRSHPLYATLPPRYPMGPWASFDFPIICVRSSSRIGHSLQKCQ